MARQQTRPNETTRRASLVRRGVTEPDAGMLRAGKRSVLVAGAQRHVAIHFIERLLASKRVDSVLAVDRGPCPPALLGADPERFMYTSADLSRPRQVDNLFLLERFREAPLDTVVHLAFQGDPRGYSIRNHEFNVQATQNLLSAALSHGVSKYIFLSSDSVYKLGPRTDFKVKEDAELDLDRQVHPIVRDTIDAEFICRAKMDDLNCEVVVMRPSGVFGGGVISGINMLFESRPPVLPVGFDPMINPTSKERLARDLLLAVFLHGKGVYNVAGVTVGPLSRFLEERSIVPVRVPGLFLRPVNRVQRLLGLSDYHAGFHPKRMFYSLVLDDQRFETVFRQHSDLVAEDVAANTTNP